MSMKLTATLRTVVLCLLCAGAGALGMRAWDMYASVCVEPIAIVPAHDVLPAMPEQTDIPPQAALAQDVQENVPAPLQEDTTVSQLTKINVPDLKTVITRNGSFDVPEPGEATPPTVGDAKYVVLDVKPAETADRAENGSQLSMIEAPVEAKLIKTLDEYKAFKREARGNYPEADFSKEYVAVLFSASNLPDKMFEIVSVQEEDGKQVLRYRINILGLDQKINTHSALVVPNSKLPLVLKQVL